MLKNTRFSFLITILSLSYILSFISCDNTTSSEKKVNHFIISCFEDVYLWNSALPKVNANRESDPYVLFNKLKYSEDRWSLLTNNIHEFNASVAGEGTSYGYELAFYYKEKNPTEIASVVKYVYANSPAEINGLKRGDIILQMNGQAVTRDNYRDLYNGFSITLGMGEYVDGEFKLTERKVDLTASKIYLDPVIDYSIIEKNNYKIGYLHYTDYLLKSHSKLNEVFTYFKNNQVDDVILDLRYNGGGYAVTSQFLCSMLVPEQVLNNREVYLSELWNEDYTQYYISRNIDKTKRFAHSHSYTNEDGKAQADRIAVNMNLSRVYIITGRNTASASEATIVSLMPYMDVHLIGDTTTGKYCGGIILSPEDYRMRDKEIQNWGAYVMVYRYANSQNYPNHVNGLIPDVLIKEDLIENTYELGDENEPLLATAIAEITGIQPSVSPYKHTAVKKYSYAPKLNQIHDGKLIETDKVFQFVSD